ncbi:MAG: CAP domain-containing protein, partial [Planctomycetota bacterium]
LVAMFSGGREKPRLTAAQSEKKVADPPKKTPPPEAPPKTPEANVAPKVPVEQQVATLLARLNDMRKAAKLAPVVLDSDLSRGCQRHADYLAKNRNHPKLSGGGFQDEDPALPGFHEEGRAAAEASVLAFAEPQAALDLWLGRVNSRPPLLHPDLQRIGVGAAQTARGEWMTVLDPTRGQAIAAVAFPAPDQKDVPLSFSGGPEAEVDSGFPISLQFALNKTPTAVTAYVADDKGNRLPALVSTPEAPLPNVRRPGLIGIIPKQALAPKTTYRVHIAAQFAGVPFKKEWRFTTEDDGDDGAVQANKMLARLNNIRRQAGVPEVKLDEEISKGCRSHAKYLVVNARRPEIQGMGAHFEDDKLPGFSPEGLQAAKASVIAIGDYEPPDALDGWMATLYHRVALLEPGLSRVGFGCARGTRLGWITVLDFATGRERGERSMAVYWPVDAQTDVPLHFPPGGETPNPIPEDKTGRAGYPVTAFYPFKLPLVKAVGRLEDSKGQDVPCWFSSPEMHANPKFPNHQGTTVCLIAKEPLKPQETYRVTLTGMHVGDPFKKSWTFTTSKAGLEGNRAAQSAIERLNHIREKAGLPAVTLDPALAKGCQNHADYLARNGKLRTATFNVIDEDPALPGFTPEGQQAARRSDVFMLAPNPTTQIDDLVGTLYRRSFVLDPRLRRVGLGCALEVGVGWINALDLNTGRDDGEPVVFPGNGQKNVPLDGRDRLPEMSSLPGYPVTVCFLGGPKIANVRANLVETLGGPVDVRLSTPENPIDISATQGNVIAIYPKSSLRPDREHTVTIHAEINGSPWNYSGRFSTAKE